MNRFALLTLVVAGCAAAAPNVHVSDSWPATVVSYDDAYDRWTRHAEGSQDWVLIIDAHATLESPEYRAAQAAEWARRGMLAEPAATKYAADERADADKAWQVELIVSTAKYEWNDFRRKDRSQWRVALVGDDGREVLPTSITEDRREREAIQAWFPSMTPFTSAYIIRFPKSAADGKPLAHDGSRLTLKIAGPIVGIDMSWGGG